MNPYRELANAIVIQAANDYRKALRDLKKNSSYEPALIMVGDCERFFKSSWFSFLTELNGEVLMNDLKKEVA